MSCSLMTDSAPDSSQHVDTSTHPANNSPYYFESDHLALKRSDDYQELLKTLTFLEAQRVAALKDLDKLHQLQEEAFNAPIKFVENLQQGKDLHFPKPRTIPQLPEINWEEYTCNVDMPVLSYPKHMTRQTKQNLDTASTISDQAADQTGDVAQMSVVRGRLKDDSKPSSFNKLWTVEEQRKLEELLVKFPPEEVEARRWQKVAAALGNRTTQQVASRVQKYFIKLARAGLPVPGRTPNLTAYSKRSGHKHQRFNRLYYQSSTFLHAYEPPVYMSDNDEDDDDDDTMSFADSSADIDHLYLASDERDVSDDECVPPELRSTAEYQELMKLKRLKSEKVNIGKSTSTEHIGYRCDKCDCEPITGTRWHCVDCPDDDSVDFCDSCVDSLFETDTHNSSHRLNPEHHATTTWRYIDKDYTKFAPEGYNYLDPNYMPAS